MALSNEEATKPSCMFKNAGKGTMKKERKSGRKQESHLSHPQLLNNPPARSKQPSLTIC
jgi:hypothetical protein